MLAAISFCPFETHLYKQVEKYCNDGAFAVAFSGGGDSTALLYALRNHPNKTHAFIVDHGLRADSKSEAEEARDFAKGLGYHAEVLTWHDYDLGQGPKTGIQEKARNSRYDLLGEACRRHNIATLLTGHTEDDQAETLLMRYDRKTDWRGAIGISPYVYAPLWPQLARVTLMRPLLGLTRKDLRKYNRKNEIKWVEDPSNENLGFFRIRARKALAETPNLKRLLLEPVADLRAGRDKETLLLRSWAHAHMAVHPEGYVSFDCVPPVELMWRVLRSVGGTGGPIDRTKLKQMTNAMRDMGFNAATLAGAKVETHQNGFCVSRDLVAVKGRRGGTKALVAHEVSDIPHIWDGRFLVQNTEANCVGGSISSAYGRMNSLPTELQKVLKTLPVSVRLTQPVLFSSSGEAVAVGAADCNGIKVESLVAERLEKSL